MKVNVMYMSFACNSIVLLIVNAYSYAIILTLFEYAYNNDEVGVESYIPY